MSVTIDQKPITVNTKIIIAIISCTAVAVAAFLNMNFSIMSELNEIKTDLKTSVMTLESENRRLESENKIQDLKLENVRLEVERNKLAIEKLRDEYKER